LKKPGNNLFDFLATRGSTSNLDFPASARNSLSFMVFINALRNIWTRSWGVLGGNLAFFTGHPAMNLNVNDTVEQNCS
jgi:hypothetical protein